MQQCQQCEHKNPDDARFCMQCGMRLGICSGCGAELPDEARFCPSCGQPAPAAFREEPDQQQASSDEAERRQLTVMFCDLVGSTELSERLDAEDYRDALAAYQKKCQEIIGNYGGWIAQYLGDGLLAYFGYPQAHEDDASRALDAALGIFSALPDLNRALADLNALFANRPMQLRIGIHSGSAVVGEIRPGEKQTELALGDTVNLCFRLLDHAKPGDVIISESVKHLCEGLFQFDELGPRALKGISDEVLLHRVLSANDARSRLDVAATRGLGRLAGFRDELALMQRRWTLARDGEGQAFVISGDPGMGKSRLVLAFREQIETEAHTWIECRCSPYGTVSAFSPVLSALEQLLGFDPDNTAEERVGKLQAALALSDMQQETALPLIASLLSLPVPDGFALPGRTPEAVRRQQLDCIAHWMELESLRQPLVLVMEDVHWIDPSTLELLQLILQRTHSTRCFVIVTHRPSFHPPWPSRGYISQVTMPGLTGSEAETVINNAAKGKKLPQSLITEIAARTDGVPLFLEELTLAILESDLVVEHADHYELTGVIDELSAPVTLQGSLMARLDRLGNAKATAQLAAVLGRECDHNLLEAVSPLDNNSLREAISALGEADLLYRSGVPPRASYRFRHALIQDVAYRSLLNRTRQNHHARVASVLEARFPELIEAQPELLARHYEEAGQHEAALDYWERAAAYASDRSAYVEAIAHARHALNLLAQQPDTMSEDSGSHAARELPLQLLVGGASIATLGHGHPDVQHSYERAQALCQEVPDVQLVSQALVGLSAYYITINELETGHALAEQLVDVAEKSGEADVMLAASLTVGIPLCFRGEPEASMQQLERAISYYDPSRHRVGTYVAGQDPGVIARAFSAWAHWLAGYPDQAKSRVEEGIALAAEHGDHFSHAFALGCASILYCLRRDNIELLESTAAETIKLCEAQGFPMFLALGRLAKGWALTYRGDESGLREIEAGRELIESSGTVNSTLACALHADALCRLGQSQKATDLVRAAYAAPKRALFWDAELLRLEGECLRLEGQAEDKVAEQYQRAIAVARQQGARAFELRSALSLASLSQNQHRAQEARRVLNDVYLSFTEGAETRDLVNARTLLRA